jgi:ATP-dependent DNA ligase
MDDKDGPLVFQHAGKLGLEGIVSKRRNSPYRSGRTPDWIKSKNPNAPAVRREAEEGLGAVTADMELGCAPPGCRRQSIATRRTTS